MCKLLHFVCVSLTLMNMSLNVLACLLSGCSEWNVLIVSFTLILVITCKFRFEVNTGKIGYTNTWLYEYLRTVDRNLFLFNTNLTLLYSYIVVSMFIYIYIYMFIYLFIHLVFCEPPKMRLRTTSRLRWEETLYP